MSGVVAQLATATVLGAVVGSAVVYGYARWAARRGPRIRFRRRTVSAEDMSRLVEAFTAARPEALARLERGRFVSEAGPELTDLPPGTRYTYVRGPVRNRDGLAPQDVQPLVPPFTENRVAGTWWAPDPPAPGPR